MSKYHFLSSADYIDKPLDCRKLTLSIYFYRMNQEQIICLSNEIVRWVYDLGNTEFVYSWSYGLKKTSAKRLWEQIMCPPEPGKGVDLAFDACVKGLIIHNLTTMNKFQRECTMIHPVYFLGWDHDPGLSSIDYLAYYNSLFTHRPSNEETISKLHAVFREPNRRCLSLHAPFDFNGLFHAYPYKEHSGLYYGKASVSFSAFCISDYINEFAEMFASFAKHIAEKYVHINAHVGLQPYTTFGNHYLRYFGQYVVTDGSHIDARCTQKEWYPTYYLCDVEWLNIISPLARQHLDPKGGVPLDGMKVSVQELLGGCLIVRSLQTITEYGWTDAVALKHYLINALHPGGKRFPVRLIFQEPKKGITDFCPRNDWAIVPVEDGEIEIDGHELVFTSISSQLP